MLKIVQVLQFPISKYPLSQIGSFLKGSGVSIRGKGKQPLVDFLGCTAGIYSSIYIHEVGHAIVYKALGASDITIEVPQRGTIFSGRTLGNFAQPLTQGQRRLAAISGLAAANLAGEVVLQ
jgi:hypothetical protein